MSDVFRSQYRELTEIEKQWIDALKDAAEHIYAGYDSIPEPRARALAKTKLEESVMWAVKGMTFAGQVKP